MGEKLLQDLVKGTGLPEEWVSSEMKRILSAQGVSHHELTLDMLRKVMAQYLQEVIIGAKESFDE